MPRGRQLLRARFSERLVSSVSCELKVLAPGERAAHLALMRTLFSDATAESGDSSVTVRFANRPGLVRDLGAFIEQERRCCSFFRFVLTVEAGEVALEFHGPEGARAAVLAALELARDHTSEALPGAITERTGFIFDVDVTSKR